MNHAAIYEGLVKFGGHADPLDLPDNASALVEEVALQRDVIEEHVGHRQRLLTFLQLEDVLVVVVGQDFPFFHLDDPPLLHAKAEDIVQRDTEPLSEQGLEPVPLP